MPILSFQRSALSFFALSLLPSAHAITQQHCFGFSNDNGYNVDASFTGVGSGICNTFRSNFKGQCDTTVVNCGFTSNEGGTVAIGALLNGRTPIDSFNCVELAMRRASGDFNNPASLDPGATGNSCIDLNQASITARDLSNATHISFLHDDITTDDVLGEHNSYLIRLKPRLDDVVDSGDDHLLFRRSVIDGSAALAIGDTIQVFSGQTLELAQGLIDGALTLDPVVSRDALDVAIRQVGTLAGNTGLTAAAGSVTGNTNVGQIRFLYDTGLHFGAGAMDQNDWIKIVGAMSSTMQARRGTTMWSIWRASGTTTIIAAICITLRTVT
jgi:hypothetical protein